MLALLRQTTLAEKTSTTRCRDGPRDAIALLQTLPCEISARRISTKCSDASHNFMPQNARRWLHASAMPRMQITPTDGAARNVHQQFTTTRLRDRKLFEPKRLTMTRKYRG
jgi:hypothetical protein